MFKVLQTNSPWKTSSWLTRKGTYSRILSSIQASKNMITLLRLKRKITNAKGSSITYLTNHLLPPGHERSPFVCLFLVPYSTVNVAWHFPGAHLHFKQMEKHQSALNVCYHILGLWNVMPSSCSDDLCVFRGTAFHNRVMLCTVLLRWVGKIEDGEKLQLCLTWINDFSFQLKC